MVTLNCDKCKKEVKELFNEEGNKINYGTPEVAICNDCNNECNGIIEESTKITKDEFFKKPNKK